MSKVTPFKAVDKRGEPPHDGHMEARVAKLEETMVQVRERLTGIETRLDGIDKTMATKDQVASLASKSDVMMMENSLIKWFVATAVALSGVAFALAKYLH